MFQPLIIYFGLGWVVTLKSSWRNFTLHDLNHALSIRDIHAVWPRTLSNKKFNFLTIQVFLQATSCTPALLQDELLFDDILFYSYCVCRSRKQMSYKCPLLLLLWQNWSFQTTAMIAFVWLEENILLIYICIIYKRNILLYILLGRYFMLHLYWSPCVVFYFVFYCICSVSVWAGMVNMW